MSNNTQSNLTNSYEHGPSCYRLHNLDQPSDQVIATPQANSSKEHDQSATYSQYNTQENYDSSHETGHNTEQPADLLSYTRPMPGASQGLPVSETSHNLSNYQQSLSGSAKQNRPLEWLRSAITEPSVSYTVESNEWILELLTVLRRVDPIHADNFKLHLEFLQRFALSINSAHDNAIESLVRAKRAVRKIKDVLNMCIID